MGCRLTIAPASPDGRAPSRPERGSGAAEAPDSISLDESGARKFLGSPAYAAPEQFRAGAALTPADFGKTCYVAGPSSVTTQAAAQQDIAAGRVTGWEYGSDGTNNAVWVNVGF
jgi:hypothetical protein